MSRAAQRWLSQRARAFNRRVGAHPSILARRGVERPSYSHPRRDRYWPPDERLTWRDAPSKALEGSATALGSILVLGMAGYLYHEYYKHLILSKIENAFAAGFSSLEKAALGREDTIWDDGGFDWIDREEQHIMDDIISGTNQGNYWLVAGEKGTGKTSMILRSMRAINGEGVAMLEAHSDLEVFRSRLGKALDYEFHEDYIGGLFSFRGPRDSTPLLDIERAFNKMEKVALTRRQKVGKPLVLVINGAHLLRDDEDGRSVLELVQQRAELWAASRLVTVVFNSNDGWITERLTPGATRLRIVPVHDIPKESVFQGIRRLRKMHFGESVSDEMLDQIHGMVGGRLRFLQRVARAPDMMQACRTICAHEKRWFLNQCWIFGEDMDDDAEDQQERCASAMVLAKALVERQDAMRERGSGHGELPRIPLHEARQIMTRADFIQGLDHINVFTITQDSMVQADSVAMQNAFREICSEPGFEDHLAATLERLNELESLGRTREITMKDLERGRYEAAVGENRKPIVISLKAVSAERNG